MQLLKYLFLGVRLSPVLLILGLLNLALGLFVILIPPVGDSHPLSGLINVAICLWVLYLLAKDALCVSRSADAFQWSLANTSPRAQTRLLVGLRAHGQAHNIGSRRVAFVAGMTPEELDRRTVGVEAQITDEEQAKVRLALQQQAELDAYMAKLSKFKRITFAVVCVFAPVLSGSIAYAAAWPVLPSLFVPVPALALYWWAVFGPADPKRLRVSVVQDVVFGRDIPVEVKDAMRHLVTD